MKQDILKVIGAIIIVIAVSSCSKKVLDITPQGLPVESTFWRTSNDAVQAYYSLFEPIQSFEEFYGRGYMWYINAGPDMVTGRSNSAAQNIKNFNPAAATASYIQDQWRFRFLVIKRANDMIKHLPTMDIDETLKNRLLGSAYFMAGLMYFELTYTYADDRAGIPIIDTSSKEVTAGDYYIPRAANAKANYDYIEGLWKRAAELLPFFEDISDPSDYGSPHKVAAWGYLSRMYLYEKEYAKSEDYADSVIQFGHRSLTPHFRDAFTIAENWGSEYIWSVVSSVHGGSELPGVTLENKGWGEYNGWGYFQPTKELYDLYEPGDERRSATILKPGDSFTYFGEPMIYSSTNSLTGYQFNKYMEPFSYPDLMHVNPNGDFPTTDLNVPLMRYAEILLIKAEDELMQGKNADAEINMIRNRANLPSISNATMADLKRERRCEFAGEYTNTYFDLVRWGDAQTLCSMPLHGFDGQVVWPERSFDPSYMNVWPVPQREIDNSGGLITQNQGW